MKKTAIILAIIAATSIGGGAQAANHVGQCVFPKTTVQKDGRLKSQPVEVKDKPDDKTGHVETKLWAMNVTAEKGKLVQVTDAAKHKVIGWVKFSDLELQEPRNCTE